MLALANIGTLSAPADVVVDDVGCWIWQGALNAKGYGPYRAYFEEFSGLKLGPGVQLDHFCRRRACVNPWHLDPVTPSENQRRRSARGRLSIERCPVGHRLVDPLRTPEGGIVCRACLETHAA